MKLYTMPKFMINLQFPACLLANSSWLPLIVLNAMRRNSYSGYFFIALLGY